jgi:hypothetical protein
VSGPVDFSRLYADTLRHEHPESVAFLQAEARDRVIAEDVRRRHSQPWDVCPDEDHAGDLHAILDALDALSAAHDKEGPSDGSER